jgi:hypothetical protein
VLSITAAMESLADRVRLLTARPVTTDPRNLAVTPCVLIEPPDLDFSSGNVTMCGGITGTFPVLVIGTTGARAELTALDSLLGEVLAGDLDFESGTLVAYYPLNNAGTADPSVAYRLTVKEMITDAD